MGPPRLSSTAPRGRDVDARGGICILSGLLGGPRECDLSRALAPSSRGLGHGPFKAATRVRIPSGSLARHANKRVARNRPVNPGDFRFSLGLFRVISGACRRILRRILRRLFRLLVRAGHGLIEVSIRHLQVVVLRHRAAVAHPSAADVAREFLRQFRLPRGPQVVEQLRPRSHASPPLPPDHDPAQLRSISPRTWCAASMPVARSKRWCRRPVAYSAETCALAAAPRTSEG